MGRPPAVAPRSPRPKGGGSLRERGPGVWELRVNLAPDPITGRQRQKSKTFRGSDRAAQVELAKLIAKTSGERTTGTSATFGRLLHEWLERKARECSPTTISQYRRHVELVWTPALGDTPLDRLKARHLQAVIDREHQRGLSAPSVERLFASARGALRLGVRLEWLDRSPHENVVLPADNRDQPDDPTPSELLEVLRAADVLDPGLGLILRVDAATGVRRGELCGVRWRDVDLEAGRLKVQKNVVVVSQRTAADAPGKRRRRKVIVKDTKTHSKRPISLDADTVELLRLLRAWMDRNALASAPAGKLVRDAFVFSREPDGSAPLQPEWISTGFRRAAQGAGVTAHLHQLRHLSASQLLTAKVPLAVVSKRLGHRKQSTTTDFYNDVIDLAADLPAAEILGTMLKGVGGKRFPELSPG
jgi:integrase